jgi:excisionase family DNA binding protein
MKRSSAIKPRLLSQEDAASYLGISYWTIRDLVFRKEIPFVKIGRRILHDRLDLDGYLDRSKIHRGP